MHRRCIRQWAGDGHIHTRRHEDHIAGDFLVADRRSSQRSRWVLGGNLDALNDCLRGGFGTPEDDDFVIEWRSHAMSRVHLSYPETVRQLEIRLLRCHSNHRESVAADLAAAKLGRGPTVFDWLVEIIGTDHHRLALT